MKLVIVESPSKAKTIQGYLGDDYCVLSSVGHIMDLATSGPGGLGIDIDNNFKPTYKIISGKKKVVNELKKQSLLAEKTYIATDLDREGEAIGFHLAQQLALDINDKNRIVFNEITKAGIIAGIKNPRAINMNLVNSQETRRIIDRIMGFKLSSLLKKKIKVRSAGRVQSVALKMIVEREAQRNDFIAEKYYKLNAYYQDIILEYEKNDKQLDLKTVNKLLEKVNHQDLVVSKITTKSKKENAPKPYITSTFQQDCINKLNFSSKKAMSIAQKLYEGVKINGQLQGLITYMRSDSYRLSDTFIKQTHEYITNTYGANYIGNYKSYKNKNAQDAHEAIRPTNIYYTPESIKLYLSDEEYLVYELIYNRSLMALMQSAQQVITTYVFSANKVNFKYSFTTYDFLGFRKLNLPELKTPLTLKQDDVITPQKYEITQHETKPEPRYTEARLIKELEQNGVGRPSTYATIIDILKTRNYVTMQQKQFVPSEDGILVVKNLNDYFSDIINISYTSSLETKLDEIANHEVKEIDVLNEFYQEFEQLYENANDNMQSIKPVVLDKKCPLCGSDLVLRKGRYGEFVGCSNYPKCKYIENTQQNEICPCPQCDGMIVAKKTKRGKTFYGCNNYPQCNYAVWNLSDLPPQK